MKTIIATLFIFQTVILLGQEKQFFGDKINESGAVSLERAFEIAKSGKAESLKVEGKIESTCAMKGCWMSIVDDSGRSMRVTFKDYGFFVPKSGVEGKKAIMQGILERKMTSKEDLKHFAEDAGKSKEEIAKITEDKVEVTFVASGVIII